MDEPTPPPDKRPVQVTIVIWLIASETVVFLIKSIRYQDWHDPYSYLTTLLVGSFVAVWIYPILWRQNWARWVQVVLPALCCLHAGGRWAKDKISWDAADKFAVIVNAIAILLWSAKAFLLVSKRVDDWFRKKPIADQRKD